MLSHVLVFWKGDREVIKKYVESFRQKTPKELVDLYNKEQSCGIIGVRGQSLYLYAMHQVFKERFHDSPIILEGTLLSLSKPLELVDGKLRRTDKNRFKNNVKYPDGPVHELHESKRVRFYDQPVLSFTYNCLVIRLAEIYNRHGDPVIFFDENKMDGFMNKAFYVMPYMAYPLKGVSEIIDNVLEPGGFMAKYV